MRKKIISFVLGFVMILSSFSMGVYAGSDTEPNNSYDTAQVLGANDSVTGKLGDTGQYNNDTIDIYKITLVQDGKLTITLSCDGALNAGISTSITSGTGAGYDDFYGYGTKSLYLGSGTYYVDVRNSVAAGNYTLTSTFNEQGLANDPEITSQTDDQATLMPLNATTTGHLGYYSKDLNFYNSDTYDIYKIEVPSSGSLTLEISKDASLSSLSTSIYVGGVAVGSMDGYGKQTFVLDTTTYKSNIFYIRMSTSASNGTGSVGGYTVKNSFSAKQSQQLILVINNPNITYNGVSQALDPGYSTVPILIKGRTMVPIRAIIEILGGTVDYDPATKKVTLNLNGNNIQLLVGNTAATVNGVTVYSEIAPVVVNKRTLIPLRFVIDNLSGYNVVWSGANQSVTITKQ